jgi:hypothetical protein
MFTQLYHTLAPVIQWQASDGDGVGRWVPYNSGLNFGVDRVSLHPRGPTKRHQQPFIEGHYASSEGH